MYIYISIHICIHAYSDTLACLNVCLGKCLAMTRYMPWHVCGRIQVRRSWASGSCQGEFILFQFGLTWLAFLRQNCRDVLNFSDFSSSACVKNIAALSAAAVFMMFSLHRSCYRNASRILPSQSHGPLQRPLLKGNGFIIRWGMIRGPYIYMYMYIHM